MSCRMAAANTTLGSASSVRMISLEVFKHLQRVGNAPLILAKFRFHSRDELIHQRHLAAFIVRLSGIISQTLFRLFAPLGAADADFWIHDTTAALRTAASPIILKKFHRMAAMPTFNLKDVIGFPETTVWPGHLPITYLTFVGSARFTACFCALAQKLISTR